MTNSEAISYLRSFLYTHTLDGQTPLGQAVQLAIDALQEKVDQGKGEQP